jgi:hypothetical protein
MDISDKKESQMALPPSMLPPRILIPRRTLLRVIISTPVPFVPRSLTMAVWGPGDSSITVQYDLIPRRIYERRDNFPLDTDFVWTTSPGKLHPNGMIGVFMR